VSVELPCVGAGNIASAAKVLLCDTNSARVMLGIVGEVLDRNRGSIVTRDADIQTTIVRKGLWR
jgi:hypothetical protein